MVMEGVPTRQSTMAPEPPMGNSSMALGRNQSSNMNPISAVSVPLAGLPDRRKQSRSIQFLMNGCVILPSMIC
jgi:hypothetical protein